MPARLAFYIALSAVSGLCALSAVFVVAEPAPAPPAFSADQIAFFEKEVQPILKNRCLKCHGGEADVKGEFRMTGRAAILLGGESGDPAVTLDKPDESPLVKAINYNGTEMPPKNKLPKEEIEVLTKWVRAGLPWTPGQEVPLVKPRKKNEITAEDRAYWAYQPVKPVTPPAVKDSGWIHSQVDAFVLEKLAAKGLSPAPPADRIALVRRAYYDLTGLPPRPEEVDAFVQDQSPEAFAKLIDRLLTTPQYGEKWGRHWLDLVRYAETHGYERDSDKPFAWRYRDYVIKSFNDDKPYNDFLREQLAGDELENVTADTLTATGYYRLGVWDDEPADRQLAKYDVLDGIVSTTGSAMLGMSIGCARCHEHKKDPIPLRDYYRLLAVFHDITDMNKANTKKVASSTDRTQHAAAEKARAAREAQVRQDLFQLEQRFAIALREKKGLTPTTIGQSDLTNVRYKFYRDTFDKLPAFDTLKAETEGPIANNYFSLEPASRTEAIGFVFTGTLQVPADGTYTFALESTDGSRLKVNDQVVLDKPAAGRQRGAATVELKAGPVPIRLDYFNGYEKPFLRLKWSSAAMGEHSLTPQSRGSSASGSILPDARTQPQSWKYTTTVPAADWNVAGFDDATWDEGRSGFGVKGTPGAVVHTHWSTASIWLRRNFLLDELPRQLILDIHHDEDVEVYLNGQLAYSGKGFLQGYQTITLPGSAVKLLRAGSNLIAVRCRQTGGGQYIDVGLRSSAKPGELAELIRQHGAEVIDTATLAKYAALQQELTSLKEQLPTSPGIEVMCVDERGRTPTHVLLRGNPSSTGDRVAAGPPAVLTETELTFSTAEGQTRSSGKRRAFAEWLVDPKNPLTARVFVNRVWQYHFGRGLVSSPNDFGKLGEGVTHPELLDWLAHDFVANGWKLKRLHKLLMLSSVYQMSSQPNAAAAKIDGGNLLMWRFPMRRLAAEEVRDSMLAVSGELNLKAGGPSVYPVIPKEVLAGQSRPGSGWGKSPPTEAARRSVYVHVKRSLLVPVLSQHDQADTDNSCPVRYTTTVPTQALGMLNGEFTQECAAALATRLTNEAPSDLPGQVRRAIRLTTGRQPSQPEVTHDVQFINDLATKHKLSPPEALKRYCLLVLNTNEFVYLD